jgi:hypothetical protein
VTELLTQDTTLSDAHISQITDVDRTEVVRARRRSAPRARRRWSMSLSGMAVRARNPHGLARIAIGEGTTHELLA